MRLKLTEPQFPLASARSRGQNCGVIISQSRTLVCGVALAAYGFGAMAREEYMRQLGSLRLRAEGQYPATGATRPIVEFTSHYELARRQLAAIAGEGDADAVDKEFAFPYRDQFDGHPASERSL